MEDRLGGEQAAYNKQTQGEIDSIVNKLVKTENATITKALEKKINELEAKKLALVEHKAHPRFKKRNFEQQARTSLNFLLSPYKIQENGDFKTRRLVLKWAFGHHLHYHRDTGARTLNKPYLFKVIQQVSEALNPENMIKEAMVRPRSQILAPNSQ